MVKTDEILADLRRLYEEQGEIPSAQDYRDNGNYPLSRIYDSERFDGFVDARKQAGIDGELEYGAPLKVNPGNVLKDIRGLWMHLGRVPTIDDYRGLGRYSIKPFYTQFDGWVDAREEAGVYSGNLSSEPDTSIEELCDDFARVETIVDGEPTVLEYERFGNHNRDTIFDRFESWEAAKRKADAWYGENKAVEVSKEEILQDLRDTDEIVDGPVSLNKYRKYGNHSVRLVLNKFESFIDARDQAGLEAESLLHRTGSDHPNHTGLDKNLYKLARFRKNRPRVLGRDNHQCKHCGTDASEHEEEYGRGLPVHHIYPTSLVDHPDDSIHAMCNLVPLCREHHDLYEGWFYGPDEMLELFGPE